MKRDIKRLALLALGYLCHGESTVSRAEKRHRLRRKGSAATAKSPAVGVGPKEIEAGEVNRHLQWTQFYYDLSSGPTSSNGIVAGAPSDVTLRFGSAQASIDDAMDPNNYGLALPAGNRLILDLSAHFLYNLSSQITPTPNKLIELTSGWQNRIYGAPCPYDTETVESNLTCGEWTAAFGVYDDDGSINHNQIIITPPIDGLQSQRAAEIGIKMVHIHPSISRPDQMLYRNALGQCADQGPYCASDSDCPDKKACIAQPVTASVTATVIDETDKIIHVATQSVTLQAAARYSIFPTNYGVIQDREAIEMIDYQRVYVGEQCLNQSSPSDLFSEGQCYSPRFFLAGPQSKNGSYPQPTLSGLSFTIYRGQYAVIKDGNGAELGYITLITDPQFGDASLVALTGVHAEPHTLPAGVGGFIVSIGFATDPIYGRPGTYTVRVNLQDGATADSHFIVIPSPNEPSKSPSPTMAPAPTMSPVPSQTPSMAPTIPTATPAPTRTASPSASTRPTRNSIEWVALHPFDPQSPSPTGTAASLSISLSPSVSPASILPSPTPAPTGTPPPSVLSTQTQSSAPSSIPTFSRSMFPTLDQASTVPTIGPNIIKLPSVSPSTISSPSMPPSYARSNATSTAKDKLPPSRHGYWTLPLLVMAGVMGGMATVVLLLTVNTSSSNDAQRHGIIKDACHVASEDTPPPPQERLHAMRAPPRSRYGRASWRAPSSTAVRSAQHQPVPRTELDGDNDDDTSQVYDMSEHPEIDEFCPHRYII